MTLRSTYLFRVLAMAVALLIGATSATTAFAQDATPPGGLPAGLQDGAQITYTNDSDYSTLIFTVFQFKDENAAKDGMTTIQNLADQSLSGVAEEERATPGAEASMTASGSASSTPVEVKDVKGLDGVGDEAHAYKLNIIEGVDVYYLLIRDGANVHYWAYVATDINAATGGGTATPEASSSSSSSTVSRASSASTPSSAGNVDPKLDVLVSIAHDWFTGGHVDTSAALIDQLPGKDQVPQGYTETDRQESLGL